MLNFPMESIEKFLNASSYLMILIGFVTIVAVKFIPAPYGRYSSKGWGVMIPAHLAWFIMESPNLWISGCIYKYSHWHPDLKSNLNLPNLILISCFLVHYTNRSIIFPYKMSFVGNSSPMPFTVMFLAFAYCSWNGMNQALSLLIISFHEFEYIYTWNFLLGMILFWCGFIINLQSDDILLQLKQKSFKLGKKTKYSIPYGGLFEYVSCANFFGEILEWLGFALACWSLPSAAFSFYVIANLGPRALEHHRWYKEKFGSDYPSNRRALIPFLL